MAKEKAFGVAGAVLLGIGSMVGAGIFIVIGQAGAIAGNILWLSFLLGGVAALLSGYSLAKLALRYPSRGGIAEYLVQGFGEGVFSGSASVLLYFSQLVAIAAVAKSFGVYASTLVGAGEGIWVNVFSIGIVALFTVINIIGAAVVAKSENIIVGIKITILVAFAVAALFTIKPQLLSSSDMPSMSNMLFAIGLTFFAYQGFSIITNTVEDMRNPKKTMMRSMIIAIVLVGLLYVTMSIAVLGNLSLENVIKTKDFALAQAAKPIFGEWGFKVIAATALLATASAINATLYAATDISYSMAKDGNLPEVYEHSVYQSYDGLIISALLIVPMILFFDLAQITTVAALVVLMIQGLTHVGHLRHIKETGANVWLVSGAALAMFGIAGLTVTYTYEQAHEIIYLIVASFAMALGIELLMRRMTGRVVKSMIREFSHIEDEAEELIKKL